MATQTQYYNLDKPSYDEVADIEVINANFDKIDQQMRNNADGVNFAKGISSDAYDNSKLYAVGDYCIYDNKLYRCITAIESAEAFNIAKWEQTTVGKEVKQLNSNLSQLEYSDVAGGKNLFDVNNIVTENNIYAYVKFPMSDICISLTDKDTSVDISGIYLGMSVDEIPYSNSITWDFIENGIINSKVATDFTYQKYYSLAIYPNTQDTIDKLLKRFNIQMEKGTQATAYEPYIPSVKMLADEVNAQNESLEWQGLTNVFDGQLQNGAYSESSGSFVSVINNVCSVNKIKCKSGDMFSIKCDETLNTIYAFFYSDSAFISFTKITNTNELKTIAPNGTTYAYIRLERDNYDINNVRKVYVYINNSIEQIKNDLGGLSFSVSGTTLSITDGTNTWTLSN